MPITPKMLFVIMTVDIVIMAVDKLFARKNLQKGIRYIQNKKGITSAVFPIILNYNCFTPICERKCDDLYTMVVVVVDKKKYEILLIAQCFYNRLLNSYAEVRNLFDEKSLSFHFEWLLEHREVTLIPCHLSPLEKKIKLRDDHGKDVLFDFSKRIVINKYVCEIINSIPFNSGSRKFIHKVKPNGIIEIVLPWTDEGYGLAVKTTGRSMRETEKIAEILKKEYGRL